MFIPFVNILSFKWILIPSMLPNIVLSLFDLAYLDDRIANILRHGEEKSFLISASILDKAYCINIK